ncbi:GNAT family N-acetyltransferase [Maritimibacter sp. DP07]|uniref:GNAT family N-acetyltransferase n=1 Tax=Maritimibacter harenae TaxID=2606218 RepID=A0A845M4M0_9RHOB|nr:GNAT family N-acetyltransferase [Maritimibacter harenae]MZR13959.1 GNAT family N-acetyltransferase [Maritimibacter harenae]
MSRQVQIVTQDDIAPSAWDAVVSPGQRKPKLLHDWAAAMARQYSRGGKLRVVAVGPRSAPEALLPLSVGEGWLRRHGFIANDDGGLAVARRDDAVLGDLAAGVIGLGKPVDLGFYPSDDPFIPAIRRAARGRAVVVLKPQETPSAPWLDLDASWAEPGTHLSRNTRQSLRRNERRLRELGEVTFEVIEPEPEAVDGLLDTAVAVEAKGWKDRTGTALSHDHRQQAFFRDYARTAAWAGRLHMAFLRLDGAAVAMSIGEIRDNVFWHYKIGYDESVAKFGPGAMMQNHLTAHLAERGVSRIEMQGHLAAYKKKWTDKAVPTTAVRIYPFTPRGLAAVGHDVARQGLKRFEARRMRAAKRETRKTPGTKPPRRG